MHNRHFVINMTIDGEKSPAFSAVSLDLPAHSADNSLAIIESSREQYALHRPFVDDYINTRYKFQSPDSQKQPSPKKQSAEKPKASNIPKPKPVEKLNPSEKDISALEGGVEKVKEVSSILGKAALIIKSQKPEEVLPVSSDKEGDKPKKRRRRRRKSKKQVHSLTPDTEFVIFSKDRNSK